MNYKKELAKEYRVTDMLGTLSFFATIKDVSEFHQCVYMIKEKNSGLFYIGKAKTLYKRTYQHRCNIISAFYVLKRKGKKFASKILPFHIRLAQLYMEDGLLEIECVVIASFGKNHPDKDLFMAEYNAIKHYTSTTPHLILNRIGVKGG